MLGLVVYCENELSFVGLRVGNNFMTRHLILFIFIIGLVSCESPTSVSSDNSNHSDSIQTVSPISLAGQVYFYAPELDTITCKATGACDCCSGEFLFLNDSEFVSVDYCEFDASYNKGMYRFVDGDIEITTDSINVSRNYNWEKETDTTGKDLVDYFISDTLFSKNTLTLKRITCKNSICFVMGDKETYYVTPNKEAILSESIDKMKRDKIWNRLKIKNYR